MEKIIFYGVSKNKGCSSTPASYAYAYALQTQIFVTVNVLLVTVLLRYIDYFCDVFKKDASVYYNDS